MVERPVTNTTEEEMSGKKQTDDVKYLGLPISEFGRMLEAISDVVPLFHDLVELLRDADDPYDAMEVALDIAEGRCELEAVTEDRKEVEAVVLRLEAERPGLNDLLSLSCLAKSLSYDPAVTDPVTGNCFWCVLTVLDGEFESIRWRRSS